MIEWDGVQGVLLIEGQGWEAGKLTEPPMYVIHLRKNLTARLNLHRGGTAWMDLWTGEPDASDGVAVLAESGSPSALTNIPLCECGIRECGNSGLQVQAGPLTGATLLGTLELLCTLPWDRRPAEPGREVWQPEITEDP